MFEAVSLSVVGCECLYRSLNITARRYRGAAAAGGQVMLGNMFFIYHFYKRLTEAKKNILMRNREKCFSLIVSNMHAALLR